MKKITSICRAIALPLMLLVALVSGFEAHAASASGYVGDIITLSIRDYSSTGASIYNDLLSGSMTARSYSWTSSNEYVTSWRERNSNFAYVVFNEPGTYTVNYELKYSFPGSWNTYTFSATWNVTVESRGPSGVSVSASSTSIYVGESTYAYATVYGGSEYVSWSASNNNVSLYRDGNTCRIYGDYAGQTRITATTSNGHSDYVYVTVREHNTISISPSSLTLREGDTDYLTADITGENSGSCSWSTSDSSVVSVYSSGVTASVTANGPGSATITARAYDGTTAVCHVTVEAKPVVLPEVTDLVATNVDEGVELTWTVPETDLDIEGFNVYRDGTRINANLVDDSRFLDSDVAEDCRYIYTVTVVYNGHGESGASNEVAIVRVWNAMEQVVDIQATVRAHKGKIEILNAGQLPVVVWAANGAVIYSGEGESRKDIDVNEGIFIVRVGRSVHKVIVR